MYRDKLTHKQNQFFDALKDIYGNEPLPSFDLISKDLGFKSKNSIAQYFQTLIEKGFLKEKANRFFIPLEEQGIPYFAGGVRAGFPTIAEDFTDEKINFDNLLVKNPSSTFSVKVIGDSMIDAGINEGDIAIVEKGAAYRNGDIVIACVDGDFTLKYFRQKNGEVFLEPANPNYPIITAHNEIQIFGLVTGLVRKY